MRRNWVERLAVSAALAVVPGSFVPGPLAPLRAEIGPTAQTVHHFAPRRVVPPKPGQTRFLTIQIDPKEQAEALAIAAQKPFAPLTATPPPGEGGGIGAGTRPDTGAAASYAWFWTMISPSLGDRSGRFPQALSALAMGPGGQAVRGPRLDHLQQIAQIHGKDILAATVGTEVSPALVLAVISTESGGRADAVSSSGAVGLMQLIPATATRFAVADSRNPSQNIKGGVAYLDWLMKEFDRDPLMVIAAYNAGENAVKGNGGVPPYAETRDYVPKVLAAWQVARGLCLSPPELVTDGCVFALKG